MKTTMNNSEHRGSPAAVRRCMLRWCLCGKWTDKLLFIVVHSAAHACAEITVMPVSLVYPTSKENFKETSKIWCLKIITFLWRPKTVVANVRWKLFCVFKAMNYKLE